VTWPRLASGLAIALVVAAIVAGLIVSGSPQRQRMLRLDEQRVRDLQALQTNLSRRYTETGALPATLEDLIDGRLLSAVPRDPESGQSYVYEMTGRRVYRLCAEFALPSEGPEPNDFWAHAAGLQCFDFDYATLRVR
jgi:type II secretory pathway pseudopilin PulG